MEQANDERPVAGDSFATIGRVAQTDECNAHRHRPQFDCSYSGDKAELILKLSATGSQLTVVRAQDSRPNPTRRGCPASRCRYEKWES